MTDKENEKVIPATPNLAGDDINFVRYNDKGEVISYGVMHRALIEAERLRGINIRETDTPPPRNLRTSTRTPAHDEADRINTIRNELLNTDKYFLSDSTLDNIDPHEQVMWREYRQKLRAAAKDSSLELPERPKPHPTPKIL